MPQSGAAVQTIRGEQGHTATAAHDLALTPPGLASVLFASALTSCWLIWAVSDAGFDRYHLPKELALALAALASVLLCLRAGVDLARDHIDQLALVSLLLSAGSSVLATSPALAVRSWSLELASTVLFLTARALGKRERASVLTSVVLAALGVALVALAESFGLLRGLSASGRAPGATLGQRNMVAHLLVLSAPSAWWLALRTSRPGARTLGVLASVATTMALLSTRSRAGWLGYAAALTTFVLLWIWRTRRVSTLAVPLAAIGAGLLATLLLPTQLAWSSSTPYFDTLTRLLDTQSGSGAGRLAQYRASLSLIGLHPWLGVGPGNWMVEYPRVCSPAELVQPGHGFLHTGRLANSDWIASVTERGIPASVCVLLLLLSVLWTARHRPWFAPLAASAVALGVVSGLDAVLQLPAPGCLAALLFALAVPRDATRAPRAAQSAWPARVSACMLSAALLWSCWAASERCLGLWARTRPSGGFAAMEAALRWNRADLLARFSLAEAYSLNGDCTRARPHIALLRALLPYHRAPRELGCSSAPE